MEHSAGFLKIVNETKPRVQEVTVPQARERLAINPHAVLVDVREDKEWAANHATEAVHLGNGVLERDIEKTIPDPATEVIFYCGGGYRSILAADTAQRMGYKNVYSLADGYRGMFAAGWPMKTEK
jgi:rhodanese-related sulfurtransferase